MSKAKLQDGTRLVRVSNDTFLRLGTFAHLYDQANRIKPTIGEAVGLSVEIALSDIKANIKAAKTMNANARRDHAAAKTK